MTREVVVNGKTVVLEARPCPPRVRHNALKGRPKGAIRLLVEQMEPGESAFLPITPERAKAANLSAMGKAVNRKLAFRTETGGVRIYCVERIGRATSTVRHLPARKSAVNGAAW